jgi:hypothetical protein
VITTNKKGNKMTDIYSMFDALQASFEKKPVTGGGQFKDILRLEKGNDYDVRLFPYFTEVDGNKEVNTTFEFSYHGWKSHSTGKYVEFLDPAMIGEPNPIKKYSYALGDEYKRLKLDKEDARMKKARKIWTQNGWLINVLVVNDPVNPDNNGTVKMVRVGKQIHDIIQEHFMGRRKEEFGPKIFDLSPKGCNLCLVVDDNGAGYKNYKNSFFKSASDCGVAAGADCEDYWENKAFNLSEVYPIKSYDELKEALDVHFLDKDPDAGDTLAEGESKAPDLGDLTKDIEVEKDAAAIKAEKPKAKATKPKAAKKEVVDEEVSIDMDHLMASLDIDE